MPRKKYVTEEEFEQFKTNDFAHLKSAVDFLRGQMWVVAGIAGATFIAVLAVLLG